MCSANPLNSELWSYSKVGKASKALKTFTKVGGHLAKAAKRAKKVRKKQNIYEVQRE
jgi:hypothetical protein